MTAPIIPNETQEQQKLIQWLRINNIFHFAPMNENKHSFLNKAVAIKQEQKAKKMGKVAGTSDIIVMLDSKILFIELKKRKKVLKSGKLSTSNSTLYESQKEFLNKVNEYKYATGKVCYGFDEAISFIKENMTLK